MGSPIYERLDGIYCTELWFFFPQVYVSHCDSPLSFYLQLCAAESELEELMDSISTFMKDQASTPTADAPAVGEACLAISELDGQWYRGVIVENGVGKVKCLFVDYGSVKSIRPFSVCWYQTIRYSSTIQHCTSLSKLRMESIHLPPSSVVLSVCFLSFLIFIFPVQFISSFFLEACLSFRWPFLFPSLQKRFWAALLFLSFFRSRSSP